MSPSVLIHLKYNETFLPEHARPSSLPRALLGACLAPLAPFVPAWAQEPDPCQLRAFAASGVETKPPPKWLANVCQIRSQAYMRFLIAVCGTEHDVSEALLLYHSAFQQMSGGRLVTGQIALVAESTCRTWCQGSPALLCVPLHPVLLIPSISFPALSFSPAVSQASFVFPL